MGKIFTVSQINQYIRGLLRADVLARSLTVSGEVSNCLYHRSGHLYFTLKDKDATLSCVMFASDRGGLSFQLQDGQKVRVSGRLDVYPQGGRYQLYAYGIEAEGEGALYARFLKLKAQLEEEGLFSEEYKRPLPAYIRTLGVVTAESGAAVRDIIQIAKRRNPYIQIVLYPAIVQGEHAADSIVRGIRTLEAYGVDAMIVGRGGGSIEDLWAFNEERVARAVFDCRVPVVSAVGHETDFTITDFAADLRAPTPSAAAELLVFEYARFTGQLKDAEKDLRDALSKRLADAKDRLRLMKKSLQFMSPQARVRDLKLQNAACAERLCERMQRVLADKKRETAPGRQRLCAAMQHTLQTRRQRLLLTAERLNGLSPLTRLKAGYGYITDEHEKRVTTAAALLPEKTFHVYFSDGKIDARVTGKRPLPFQTERT